MPNTVVKLTNAESTWLEAAREDRKLLINMKAHLQRCAFFLSSFGSGFRVQGSRFMVEIERFRPLRMTIREGGWALIWEICCVFWN